MVKKRKNKYVPLKNTFVISSIVGFFVSVIYISKYSFNWSVSLGLIFLMMFIASMITMTKAPVKL
jgi:hypothetical protein